MCGLAGNSTIVSFGLHDVPAESMGSIRFQYCGHKVRLAKLAESQSDPSLKSTKVSDEGRSIPSILAEEFGVVFVVGPLETIRARLVKRCR